MAIQVVLIIIIAALLGYIVFLHVSLTKKNIFIESTVRRLSGIEKSRSMEEMMAFLQEIQKLSQYRSFFTDKFLEESTLNFILENEKEVRIYMHYTKEEADAMSILKNGFRFADSFYKTALQVSSDKLDMKIKHNSRKYFGDYLVIICISNDVINFYSLELEKAGIKTHSFENILTEHPPFKNENGDILFQLSSQFIKGYINLKTGLITRNHNFDPWYNSDTFKRNIDLLKNK
jgi:hypothetical protein